MNLLPRLIILVSLGVFLRKKWFFWLIFCGDLPNLNDTVKNDVNIRKWCAFMRETNEQAMISLQNKCNDKVEWTKEETANLVYELPHKIKAYFHLFPFLNTFFGTKLFIFYFYFLELASRQGCIFFIFYYPFSTSTCYIYHFLLGFGFVESVFVLLLSPSFLTCPKSTLPTYSIWVVSVWAVSH